MGTKATSRILIIEDDAVLAANLQEMLEDLGYGVVGVAGTLPRAKKAFAEKDVDLLLADISLKETSPGIDGIELCSRLTKERKVPIIFLTAHAGEEYRKRTRYLHPAAYLIKPVQERQLDISVDFALFNWYESGRAEVSVRASDDWRFYAKKDGRNHGIWVSDICYLAADGGNCWLYTKQRRHYITTNMGSVVEQIGPENVVKVHRSYAVNRRSVHSYDANTIYVLRDHSIDQVPYSDNFRTKVQELLPRLRLD